MLLSPDKEKNKRPYTPAIFRKGLIMVLVPGILGSAFLLVLNDFWLSSGRLSLESQRRNQIVIKLNNSFTGLVSYFFDLMTYCFQNSSSVKSRAIAERQDLVQQLKELHDVAEYDSKRTVQVRAVENSIAKILMDADKIAAILETKVPDAEGTTGVIKLEHYKKSVNPVNKFDQTIDRYGVVHHWGYKDSDLYTVRKLADGTVIKTYDRENSKEYKYSVEIYYPNGRKRLSSKDGKIGYTSDRQGNEHHWGLDDADNYDIKKQADGTVVKTFAKDHLVEFDYANDSKKFTTADGKIVAGKEHSVAKSSDHSHSEGLVSSRFYDNRQRFLSYAKIIRSGLEVADSIQTIVEEEHQAQDIARGKQDSFRQTLKNIVLLGFVCGGSVSLIILVGFARDIIIRLRVLNLNAVGLAKLKKSVNRLNGDDELAYLDAVFYETEEELLNAAEQHKTIMQMVAHDMRSPIMAMQIYIELFQDLSEDSLQQTSAQWCDSIKVGANRVLSFVTDLLTLERLESGEDLKLQTSEFSLGEAAAECWLGLSASALKKSVSIKIDCSDQMIVADRERVMQVITNYLAIAMKCATEGTVILLASEQQADGSITVSVTENNQAWLTSAGTGNMFGKFQLPQDRDENSEFRLSLATSKVLIEAHGGAVGAISAPGIGSKFWFSIPASCGSVSLNAGNDASRISGDSDNQYSKPLWREVFRPGLLRKALILTAFPLIVQAAWLLWINVQLDEAERLEKLERRQSDVVSMIHRTLVSIFRANTGLAFFIVSHNNLSKDMAIENFDLLNKEIPALDVLTSDDPAKQEVWHDLRAFVRSEIAQLQRTFDTSQDNASTELSEMALVVARAGNLLARIGTLQSDELLQLSKIQVEQESFRSNVQSFIYWAIPVNLAMYFSLLWFFTVSITRRLHVVVDNARRLPGREVLEHAVRGTDEIALLDVLLHQTAHDLAKADEQREGMMDIVAHDIRSPLIAVETSLSQLERSLPSDLEEKAVSCLKSVRGNVNRVLRLADDLLTLGNLDENKIELKLADCQLQSLAQEAADSIATLAQAKNISIKVDCPDLTINLDEGRMMQVLINLLANAIKFSPKNSNICIGGRKLKSGMQIFVEDEGSGMDAETASRIFDKFVSGAGQTEKAFGLGLAICKLIVTAHGGTLNVDSQLGRGSTFFIFLPSPAS